MRIYHTIMFICALEIIKIRLRRHALGYLSSHWLRACNLILQISATYKDVLFWWTDVWSLSFLINQYNKTVIRFSFCDIQNNQGFDNVSVNFLDLDYFGYHKYLTHIISYYCTTNKNYAIFFLLSSNQHHCHHHHHHYHYSLMQRNCFSFRNWLKPQLTSFLVFVNYSI